MVAAAVAEPLGAPLDIVVARKLGVPWQPELAFGAVAPGVVVLREDVVAAAGLARADIDAAAARESAKLDDLARAYRGDVPALEIRGRCAIVVDDGLATGATATAAVRSVRAREPARIVVAVPVCAGETARDLRREVDEVICLGEYRDFHAVGLYYDEFGSVPDATVRDLLARSRRAPLGR